MDQLEKKLAVTPDKDLHETVLTGEIPLKLLLLAR